MIFVTVGSHTPFDRLLEWVDEWARNNPSMRERVGEEGIIAQIGESDFESQELKIERYLTPVDYRKLFSEADFIIGHAGTGTILTALDLQKPIVMLPREADLGETRNNHQIATARHFRGHEGMYVCCDKRELFDALDQLSNQPPSKRPEKLAPTAQPSLIQALRDFIDEA